MKSDFLKIFDNPFSKYFIYKEFFKRIDYILRYLTKLNGTGLVFGVHFQGSFL